MYGDMNELRGKSACHLKEHSKDDVIMLSEGEEEVV
jgi:hypothetical protein